MKNTSLILAITIHRYMATISLENLKPQDEFKDQIVFVEKDK